MAEIRKLVAAGIAQLCVMLSVAIGLGHGAALADTRLALVIGVSDTANPLPNADVDARRIAQTLKEANFDVDLAINPTKGDIYNALGVLSGKAEQAPSAADVTIVFYFAGHGVQVANEGNYLIPSRTTLLSGVPSPGDIIDEGISANRVLSRLRESRASRLIMILDACRSQLFPGSATGLAKMPVPSGGADTMVIFSAQPGEAALDGAPGMGSYFANALGETIALPGLDVGAVFTQVTTRVVEQTGERQKPSLESGLFRFKFHEARGGDLQAALRDGTQAAIPSAETANELYARAVKSRGIDSIREGAGQNVAEDMWFYALALRDGSDGVTKDPEAAMRLMRRAVVLGVPGAVNSLGYFYCCDGGPDKNEREAVEWFLVAAEMGSVTALRNLGFSYQDGTGVERDLDKAEKYFREAYRLGQPRALYDLASIYAEEKYGRHDPRKALLLREEAFEKGYVSAATQIANTYRYGWLDRGATKDPLKALEYLVRGGERGCASCWTEIAKLYETDELGEPNLEAAFSAYLRGAGDGDIEANMGVGRAYAGGKGVAKNLTLAFEYYQAAAEKDHLEAIGSMGKALAKGDGVAKDPQRAAPLLRRVLRNDLNPDVAERTKVYDPNYWGYGHALADLLEAGAIAPETPDEAKALRARYGASGASMKRFTVPIDCAGIKWPFHIYILNWDRPNDETPADTQAVWLKEQRGCIFPTDVSEAFRKLKVLARENNVSFTDLTVLALEAAQKETAQPANGDAQTSAPR